MPMNRRHLLLRSAPSCLVVPSLLAPSFWSALQAARPDFPAALLVPRTGEHAALGRSMERAAMLAQEDGSSNARSNARQLLIFDTTASEGATGAARLARRAGARILLGPIFARELPGVIGIAGPSLPVISFSNDAALRESGAFVFGITAAQIVTALLRYAAARGIRRIAVAPGGTDGWSAQVTAAAAESARLLGIELVSWPGVASLGSSGASPDAVLIAQHDQLAVQAAALTRQGVQVLGATTGLDLLPETLRALDGVCFAAPDPARFAGFARAYEDRVGSPPGLITGLAYDAMRIVAQLRQGGGVDRSALLAATGFAGVCGNVRFREDGSAARSLAILQAKAGGLVNVAMPEA